MQTNKYEAAVMGWIRTNFDTDAITIKDFPALPYGKRIIDVEKDQMVIFYDYLIDDVKYLFPAKVKQ